MPRPYHTPKSERDEKVGALSASEQISEIEDALETYSDLYKEVFGVRPRDMYRSLRDAGASAIREEIRALRDYNTIDAETAWKVRQAEAAEYACEGDR
jgi:hypothetical protein